MAQPNGAGTIAAPAGADDVPPQFALLELLNGMWVARAIQVAAELGIADLLVSGPQQVTELAAATGTQPQPLARLLHALSTIAVFDEVSPGTFGQTARSRFLRTGRPGSVRNAARLFGSDWQWRSWGEFMHTMRTGEPAFESVMGESVPDYLDEVDPTAGELFDAAMYDMAAFLDRAIAASYDFGSARTVVDVSGGHSRLLTQLLQNHPTLQGVLVDRPAVIARLETETGTEAVRAGLDGRLRFAAADYLSRVPATGDLVVLNRVLHDWDDNAAGGLLEACLAALPPNGRLLVIEQVLQGGPDGKRAAFLDLQMMVLRGGAERTVPQYRDLLGAAGFTDVTVHPTPTPMVIIEARPATGRTTEAEIATNAGSGS